MGLVIPQLCFPLLAVLAVNKLIFQETDFTEAWKKLKLTGIITGIIVVLLAGYYFTASFSGKGDKMLKDNFKQSVLQQVPRGQQPSPQIEQQADDVSRSLIGALQTDRKELMGTDLLRSLILIALAFLVLGLFVKKKISSIILITSLIVLSGYDLIGVATRYLNTNNFVDETDYESAFSPTDADLQIMKDPDHANFRVFNSTVDPFNDASTSFHHNSVGGYHPAKLGLYNDMITYQLSKGNMRVFDMLNTKYFIVQNPQNGKPVAQLNPGAFGNAWLVQGIKYVENANEEMQALDSTDLRDSAVVEKKYQPEIKQSPVRDSSAYIKLKENLNDKIEYTFHSKTPQYAVLSEVYYPLGWDAFIDGKKADYMKTNYILRGMYVPAGDHQIEFIFEPKSFSIGRTVTIIANIIVFLAMLATAVFYIKGKDKSEEKLS
jgi:hypothetical protein